MSKQIRIITKKVGEHLKFDTIEHSLENMQKLVGGTLDGVSLPERIVMWVDDEGLIKEKPINLITYVENQEVHHIAGDVFFTGIDEEGETVSLSDEQMVWITNRFKIVGKSKNKEGEEYFVYGLMVR
jgi:hypothetical protein